MRNKIAGESKTDASIYHDGRNSMYVWVCWKSVLLQWALSQDLPDVIPELTFTIYIFIVKFNLLTMFTFYN